MTIDVPDQIVRNAKFHGLTVEEELQRLATPQVESDLTGLIPVGQRFATLGEAVKARKEAGERLLASTATLGGLKIKDLINEGRKH